ARVRLRPYHSARWQAPPSSLGEVQTVTGSVRGRAKARLGHLPVRPQAILRVRAPEGRIAGMAHRRIRLRPNVHSFPAQTGAKIRAVRVEHFSDGVHSLHL